jgi:hypothetical protein
MIFFLLVVLFVFALYVFPQVPFLVFFNIEIRGSVPLRPLKLDLMFILTMALPRGS